MMMTAARNGITDFRVLLALALLSLVAGAVLAEQQPGEPFAYTAGELETLVGPIALYPDDLLALTLRAAQYPLQIVQAARYLEDHEIDPDLEPDPDWDESIVALLNYPEVIALLDEDLYWTEALGESLTHQEADVLAAIQNFRERAVMAGNLATDDHQVVSVEEDAIEIESIEPDVIYVPYYEPEQVVVYQSVPVYRYYADPRPVYYYPYPAYYASPWPYFWGVTMFHAIYWNDYRRYDYGHGHHYHPYYRSNYAYRDHYYRERRHENRHADRLHRQDWRERNARRTAGRGDDRNRYMDDGRRSRDTGAVNDRNRFTRDDRPRQDDGAQRQRDGSDDRPRRNQSDTSQNPTVASNRNDSRFRAGGRGSTTKRSERQVAATNSDTDTRKSLKWQSRPSTTRDRTVSANRSDKVIVHRGSLSDRQSQRAQPKRSSQSSPVRVARSRRRRRLQQRGEAFRVSACSRSVHRNRTL